MLTLALAVLMNHYDYFSDIEERFTARRGSLLLLSTLDWALIETWREAEIPLAAVLRGIDTAFDRYETRKLRAKGRLAKVNGLAWCAQAVMEAATEMAEAAVGVQTAREASQDSGFQPERIAAFLELNALVLGRGSPAEEEPGLRSAMAVTADRLRQFAVEIRAGGHPALDELDLHLTVLEERLHAAVIASVPEIELLAVREIAERELAPYRTRMGAVQGRQVREQFVHKRLFEARGLPRLSLFYMPQAETAGEAAA